MKYYETDWTSIDPPRIAPNIAVTRGEDEANPSKLESIITTKLP